MPLEFATVPVTIGETSGTFTSNEERTFSTTIRSAEAAIKHFKLDAVGSAKPSDIVQVGLTGVSFHDSTVEFTVKARYSTGGGKFTGEVHVLVIAQT